LHIFQEIVRRSGACGRGDNHAPCIPVHGDNGPGGERRGIECQQNRKKQANISHIPYHFTDRGNLQSLPDRAILPQCEGLGEIIAGRQAIFQIRCAT
jgi:hypothetical protein